MDGLEILGDLIIMQTAWMVASLLLQQGFIPMLGAEESYA